MMSGIGTHDRRWPLPALCLCAARRSCLHPCPCAAGHPHLWPRRQRGPAVQEQGRPGGGAAAARGAAPRAGRAQPHAAAQPERQRAAERPGHHPHPLRPAERQRWVLVLCRRGLAPAAARAPAVGTYTGGCAHLLSMGLGHPHACTGMPEVAAAAPSILLPALQSCCQPVLTALPLRCPRLALLAGNGGYAETLTPEQQHQAFLSRLLLMLGSFVIMVSFLSTCCTARPVVYCLHHSPLPCWLPALTHSFPPCTSLVQCLCEWSWDF